MRVTPSPPRASGSSPRCRGNDASRKGRGAVPQRVQLRAVGGDGVRADFGLTQEEAERISAAFGGGFSRLRETCGTVSGAAMVLSLRYGAGTGSDREKKRVSTRPCRISPRRSPRSTARTSPRAARARPGAGFPRPRSAHGRVLQPPPLRKICACGRRAARTLFIAAFGFPSRKRRGNPSETPPLSGIRRGRSVRRSRSCLRRFGLRRRFQKTSPPHKAGGVLKE